MRNNNADLLHAAAELRGLRSPGLLVLLLLFFTSMVFCLIEDINLLNSLSFLQLG